MFCKTCGKEIPDGSAVCPECGAAQGKTKFCRHCGAVIDADCVVCPKCGKQVETLAANTPNIVINNSNNNANTNVNTNVAYGRGGKPKNKWTAFFLCLFFGGLGAHKFYEGKILLGFVYMFTAGLFFVGWILDFFKLIFKPNPYYV